MVLNYLFSRYFELVGFGICLKSSSFVHNKTSCFIQKENCVDNLGEGLNMGLVLLYSA